MRLPLDELRRQAGQVGVVALEFAHGAACWSSFSGFAFGGVDPVGDLGRGRLAMMHAGQRRHRLGALLAAADRHMRRLVGAEDGQRMLQRFELVAEFVEFGEGHVCSRIRFGERGHQLARHRKPGSFCRMILPEKSNLQDHAVIRACHLRAAALRWSTGRRTCWRRTKMIANILIALVAALHLYFMYLEMVAWDPPPGRKAFSLTPEFATRVEGACGQPGPLQRLPCRRPVWGLYLGERRVPGEDVLPDLRHRCRPVRRAHRSAATSSSFRRCRPWLR